MAFRERGIPGERAIPILPGQYFDAETGQHQNWHRDYDPSIGRYLQSDPAGLDAGINTYAYALNNPLTFIDDDGLCPSTLDPGRWTNPVRQEKDWVKGKKCMTKYENSYQFFGTFVRSEGSCECGGATKTCVYSVVLRTWSRRQSCGVGPWSPWSGSESRPHEVRGKLDCKTGKLRIQGPKDSP